MSETAGLFETPQPGHNLPKLSELIPPDVIGALIAAETEPLRERATALTDSCKRFLAAYAEITTDEQDGVATAILAQCQRFTAKSSGRVDSARVALKAPVLVAQKQIDAAFPPIADGVTAASNQVAQRSIAFKRKKEDALRKAAEAEAAKKREEAEAAERLASAGSGSVTYEDAAKAYDAADQAQRIATAKPADLTRMHGPDFGASSLKRKRVVSIPEPHLVPRIYCVPDKALVERAAGKAGDPFPTIPGVKIEDVDDLTVRR